MEAIPEGGSSGPPPSEVGSESAFKLPTNSLNSLMLGESSMHGYERKGFLGRGSQAFVYKVVDECGDVYALKEIKLKGALHRRDFPRYLTNFDRELRLLRKLAWASEVVVPVLECWLRTDWTACIVMEYLPHQLEQTLTIQRQTCVGPYSGDVVVNWLAQLALGLAAIHSQNFIHRDIKSSNILLSSDMRCKIADAGVCRALNQHPRQAQGDDTETMSCSSKLTARVGTATYSSPEIMSGNSYGIASDMFSLGCVLLEIITLEDLVDLRVKCDDLEQPFLDGARLILANTAEGMSNISELQHICLQLMNDSPNQRPSALNLISNPLLLASAAEVVQRQPHLSRVYQASSHSQAADLPK